jgi:hypothetical protein
MGSNFWLGSNERSPTAVHVHGLARVSCSRRPSSSCLAPFTMSGFGVAAFGGGDGGITASGGGASGSESAGGGGPAGALATSIPPPAGSICHRPPHEVAKRLRACIVRNRSSRNGIYRACVPEAEARRVRSEAAAAEHAESIVRGKNLNSS